MKKNPNYCTFRISYRAQIQFICRNNYKYAKNEKKAKKKEKKNRAMHSLFYFKSRKQKLLGILF